MKLYFLDAGFVSVTDLLWLALIVLLGITVVEWIVLLLFSINTPGKAFLHSLIVNVASAVLGYALAEPVASIGQNDSSGLLSWFVFFAVTLIVEGFLLQLLNKQKPAKKVWLAAITMNIVTYAALYFLAGYREY